MILRVMFFEKFNTVFFDFYIIFVLGLSSVFSVIHWAVSLLFFILALFLFTNILARFEFLKRSLIYKNDRIEYADPRSQKSSEMFKIANVLLKMKPDEVKKTSLISEELMEGNRHFYLVQSDEKPTVIAYDWIMGIRPEMLEEFDDVQGEETTAQKE